MRLREITLCIRRFNRTSDAAQHGAVAQLDVRRTWPRRRLRLFLVLESDNMVAACAAVAPPAAAALRGALGRLGARRGVIVMQQMRDNALRRLHDHSPCCWTHH